MHLSEKEISQPIRPWGTRVEFLTWLLFGYWNLTGFVAANNLGTISFPPCYKNKDRNRKEIVVSGEL
jgi:hypothetical protein